MACGLCNESQEMEVQLVAAGFAEFLLLAEQISSLSLSSAFFSLVGLLSELIDISVDVTITANIKCTNFELGAVQVVIDDCFCILGAVKIKLLSG